MSETANVKYDMRAPPRRRIKGEDPDDQPVFLRKAFVMISTCPSHIGGWSEKGDTVVIKDAKIFAEKIIPTAYKHNNFSSFVRQLNFYGFRKIKSEAVEHALWWEFRHPHFLRDQPHLLSEIKRSVHYANDTPNVHEMSDLKSQVGTLTERIDALNEQIEMLTGAVSDMQLASSTPQSNYNQFMVDEVGAKKKRKVVAKRPEVKVKLEPGLIENPPYLMRLSSIDSSLDLAGADNTLPTGPELASLDLFRSTSIASNLGGASTFSFDGNDEESWIADMSRLLRDEPETPPSYVPAEVYQQSLYGGHCSNDHVKSSMADNGQEKNSMFYVEQQDLMLPQAKVVPLTAAPAGGGVQDLFNILESLSPELKIRFVDKLAEVMGKQLLASGTMSSEGNNASVTPVVTAATTSNTAQSVAEGPSSTSSSRRHISPTQNFAQLTTGSNAPYHLPSSNVPASPEVTLPMASAALGAFVITSLNSLMTSQQLETAHSMSRKAQFA